MTTMDTLLKELIFYFFDQDINNKHNKKILGIILKTRTLHLIVRYIPIQIKSSLIYKSYFGYIHIIKHSPSTIISALKYNPISRSSKPLLFPDLY